MNKDSIELSPKYGLNPTIPTCFWCGKDKSEVYMLGRIRRKDPQTGKSIANSDEKAPMHMCMDYEPCDNCKAIMSQGITLIGVKPTDGKHKEIQKGFYPTGVICTLKPEAFERMFKTAMDKATFNDTVKKKLAFMDSNDLKDFITKVNTTD